MHLLAQGVPPKVPIQVLLVQRTHEEKEKKEVYQTQAIVTPENKILSLSTNLPVPHQCQQGWLLHCVLHPGSNKPAKRASCCNLSGHVLHVSHLC